MIILSVYFPVASRQPNKQKMLLESSFGGKNT